MIEVRLTKAFCVGQAKSGTASLYGLLASHYRAAHEPERAKLLEMILRESHGQVSQDAFRAFLAERDRRLNLEYDIAWANQFIANHLLEVFPEARFIILIRDPYSWIQSTIGHLLSREIPPEVRSFLDWWYKPELYPHTRHDSMLREQGVYSIAAFLNVWNWHVNTLTAMIPSGRRLILRTHEIDQSHKRLAEFLEIPVNALDVINGHLNQSTWIGKLDSLVKPDYLNEKIAEICGENLVRYFPEITGSRDFG